MTSPISLIALRAIIKAACTPIMNTTTTTTTVGRVMEQQPPVEAAACHVVAIPYPGRGHINPMMNLCEKLASKKPDTLITFIVTEEWLEFIGGALPNKNIVLSTIPNVVTSELERGKNMTRFIEEVSTKMEAAVEEVLDRRRRPADVIVVDSFLCWGVGVGKRRNIPVASFWPMAASVLCFTHHFHLLQHNGHFPLHLSEKANEVVDYIPGIPPTRLGDLPSITFTFEQYLLQVISGFRMAQFMLVASIYELETQSFDALSKEFTFPVYAVGPCIPHYSSSDNQYHQYLQWLDTHPTSSVLFISFGSYISISATEMDEIALGLKDSGVPSLWVARDESSRLKDLLGPTTMVLTVEWCDQMRVLSHGAVGGFWTHCGWNSIKEGMFAGVPFITLPVGMDQFLNSKRVVEDWKIGWRLRDCTRLSIAGVVRRFMDMEDEESRGMRMRVKQIQGLCQTAVGEDGSAQVDINNFSLRF